MDINWLRKKDLQIINTFLSTPHTLLEFSETESSKIDIDSHAQTTRLPNITERKIFERVMNALPAIERESSDNFYKYSDVDICPWEDFRIGSYDVDSLNDKFESMWFSTFINSLGENWFSGYVKSVLKRGNIFATYTTESETNVHYMTSVYSPNAKNVAKYNKEEVLNEFNKLKFKRKIYGYVRYGERKFDLWSIWRELKRRFPSSKALKLAMLIINFFVKGKCMKQEKEFRFLVLPFKEELKNLNEEQIILKVIPTHHSIKKDDRRLMWNHFYPFTGNHPGSSSECGCKDKWEIDWPLSPKYCS